MVVHVLEDGEAVARAVVDRLQSAVTADPQLVLGLPAGRSPLPVYAELTARGVAGRVDLSGVTTFNLDEFAGIRPGDPGSFRHFMDEHLFRRAGVDPGRVQFLDGSAPDVDAECRRYDEAIVGAGGIGLQLLGIGENGHVAFNEPADTLLAATHRVQLHPSTRAANAYLFDDDVTRVPEFALTVGMSAILASRELVMIATGERKASAVAAAVHGPLTTRLPASFLQLHRHATLFLDRRAASRLP